MFDALRKKFAEWRKPAPTIVQRAAPKVQAMIRESSRTPRGNVPWFKGPMRGSSNIPTTVTAEGDNLKIVMVDWALKRENDKGLAGKIAALLNEEIRAMKGGK